MSGSVEVVICSPWEVFRGLFCFAARLFRWGLGGYLRFGPLLYSIQLVLPVSLESLGPLVERLDGRGIGAVEAVAAVAADAHEIDAAQNAKVF